MELKKYQETLIEETNKSMHASRLASLGEMAGGIAHEINNPLSIAHLHLEQLEKRFTTEPAVDSEYLGEKTRRIMAALLRISRIVKGLRQFSQQADSEEKVDEKFSVILEETLGLCAEKLRNKGIQLDLQIPEEFYIHCRAVQISQILINLLNNAYDEIAKSPEQGFIQIKTQVQNGSAHIQVSNSGQRILPELREKIFLPFFTTKEVGHGTGLGLSISQGIARDHGGELVLLENTELTTFELRLPTC